MKKCFKCALPLNLNQETYFFSSVVACYDLGVGTQDLIINSVKPIDAYNICVSKLTSIGSDNGLSAGRRQAIIWTNATILLFQLRSLNLDDFAISINVDKLQLVEQAKYLGLWVRNDLSWDDHILELCRKMHYYVHMFRRLRKILPSQLLLNIYKSYVQSKIDYGLSIWSCTTEAKLDRKRRIQNLLARIVCDNFDYINLRGIEMVQTLRVQTIHERRDYFLCILMFKCIHGFAPHYLCNDVIMYIDINGYNTRSAENMDLYLPCTLLKGNL